MHLSFARNWPSLDIVKGKSNYLDIVYMGLGTESFTLHACSACQHPIQSDSAVIHIHSPTLP